METLTHVDLHLPLVRRGKVRDSFLLDDSILMVATDRLSAFDVVFSQGIPHKGAVLTQLSKFWFDKTSHIIPNHIISMEIPKHLPQNLRGRSMVVKKAIPLRLECVVRGYITGGGFNEYKKSGSISGISLPSGLKNGDKLSEPIFTPTTKADQGHDQGVTPGQAINLVGDRTFEFIKKKSIELYQFAHDYALKRGLVLADTKFEFGYLREGNHERIILIDEALTPDSSRYWIKEKYDQGTLESLDKQFVRDYLESIKWNKLPPAPILPKEVIDKTTQRYLSAYEILTGLKIQS
jgi:phosphoribosylaminoimidazole-succinocarboxamide synthase